jgi:putative ABC transport system permease protein
LADQDVIAEGAGMKYFPLVWAALRRKPTRVILTLLSVTIAFTLFGLMIGMNATVNHLLEIARLDRIYVSARFDGNLLQSQRDQIARLDGVKQIGTMNFLGGYYQNPKNRLYVYMIDQGIPHVWTELPLTPRQLDQLQTNRTGIFMTRKMAERFHRKAGDTFPVVSPMPRADGLAFWTFKVLGVIDDVETNPRGLIIGNADYYEQAIPVQFRGTIGFMELLVKNPSQATQVTRNIDALFANSQNPTRSVTQKVAAESSAGSQFDVGFVTLAVAGAGMFMILFLTANSIAQSVRERIPEFAVMKTLGFSDGGLMALVFAEAALPCLIGAGIGMILAMRIVPIAVSLVPPWMQLPIPTLSPGVVAEAFVCAALVALLSAILPVLRLKRLDVASAMSGR